MPYTEGPGPKIYYQTDGKAGDAPVVLIEGMGAQLIGWRQGFVDRLVDRGCFVIRLDNRDVGLSDKLGGPDDHAKAYSIGDMARDVCRTLDSLGLESAHIVGQSLGGAVAQTLADEHRRRVRSMVLFYTLPVFAPEFLTEELLQAVAVAQPAVSANRDEAIEARLQGERMCASTAYCWDEAWMRELAGQSHDRDPRTDGAARQRSAALQWAGASDRLWESAIPTAIIHGRADRLIKYEASIALARLIENAEIHLYSGMGHQIVQELWDDFIEIIVRTVGRAH